jgi:hypothetical protein
MQTFAEQNHVDGQPLWNVITQLVGTIGVVTMCLAVGLSIASFANYLRRYGALFTR